MSRVSRIVTALELPAVLAMAPALLFPTTERMTVLAVMPVLWLGARLSTGRAIPNTPFNVVLWTLLTMVGVSLYATYDVRFSLGKVAGVIFGVLLFWAAGRWMTTPARLWSAGATFLLAGAGLAAAGLLGTNWADKFPVFASVSGSLPRAIRGVPGAVDGFHPNAVAGSLVLFIPLQIALLATGVHRWLAGAQASRISEKAMFAGQALLLVLTAGTLALTQSRGAWAGMLVAGLSFLCWHSRQTRLVAVVALLLVLACGVSVGPERLLNVAISRTGPGMAGNVTGRAELWSRALYGIRDFPLTGMGMNTFRRVMPAMYPAPSVPPDVDIAHAHNQLLQAGLDLGVPGLCAYVALWLLAAMLLVQVYRESDARPYRVLAGGIGAGLVAHCVFSMTDAIPLGSKVGILFWLTLALTVGLHRIAAASRTDSKAYGRSLPHSSRSWLWKMSRAGTRPSVHRRRTS